MLLIWLPLLWTPSRVNLFGVGLVFAMLCCSLVVLTGWAGQISLGQLAIGAMGMCVAGTLFQQGKNFFLCIAIAGVVGAGVAVAIGVPALRIRGPFLAVTTLAFAQATGSFIVNEEYFDWLVPDRRTEVFRPVLFDKFDLESEYTYYFVLLFALALVVVDRVATADQSDRPDDHRHQGQPGGWSVVRHQRTPSPAHRVRACQVDRRHGRRTVLVPPRGLAETWLEPETSVTLFVIAVTGGLGSLPGAFLGAGYLTFVDYSPFTRQDLSRLRRERHRRSAHPAVPARWTRRSGCTGSGTGALRLVARRRDISVPSLIADSLAADAPLLESEKGRVPSPRTTRCSSCAASTSRTGERRSCSASTCMSSAARCSPCSARTVPESRRSCRRSAGSSDPDEGTVTFDRADITGHSPQELVASGIVMMPGGKAIFPTLTVAENLLLAGWPWQKSDPQHVDAAIERALSTFPVLRERAQQKAGNLSGGEQQMLALGQALIAKPKLLLIDELSLGLAPIVVGQLLGHRQGDQRGGNLDRHRRAVREHRRQPRPPSRVPREGRGAIRRTDRRAARAGRHPPRRLSWTRPKKVAVPAVPTGNGQRRFVPVCEACGHEHGLALAVEDVTVNFGGIRAVDEVTFEVGPERSSVS